MKLNALFVLSLMLLLFAGVSGNVMAQQTAPSKADVPAVQLPYCDALQGLVKSELQPRANLECRSVQKCIDCIDRTTTKQTCVEVTVQPDKNAKCAVRADLPAEKKNQTNAVPGGPDGFEVRILQSTCVLNGISLEVVVTDVNGKNPVINSRYAYDWQLDGRKIGTGFRVECANGKEVVLKVTQKATGKSKSTTFRLLPSGGDNKMKTSVVTPKPMAVFKKTGCYGYCPVYTVEFFDDGSVMWNGQMNVTPVGSRSGHVDAAIIEKIVRMAGEIHFFELRDKYPEDPVADAEGIVIALNFDGQTKEVEHIFGGPEGLVAFENFFLETIKKLGWAGPPLPKTTDSKLNNKSAKE